MALLVGYPRASPRPLGSQGRQLYVRRAHLYEHGCIRASLRTPMPVRGRGMAGVTATAHYGMHGLPDVGARTGAFEPVTAC